MKILSIVISIVIVISLVAYFFLQPEQENIYGRGLVIAFVNSNQETTHDVEPWSKLDLALQIEHSCENNNKREICVNNIINKALDRTKSVNKKLIVLADGDHTDSVLMSLQNIESNIKPIVVIVSPDFNELGYQIYVEKILVVNNLNNTDENLRRVRKVTSNMRRNNWVWSTKLIDSGSGLFNHSVLPHMVSYLINGPVDSNYKVEFEAESLWQQPPVNNDEFWKHSQFIEKYPVSVDIKRILDAFYAYDESFVKQWPLNTYHSFNLIAYRNSLPLEKQGRYVSFSNRKGHKFYLDLNKYGEFGPEFVIGIDNEKNLYRMTSFYKTKRYYSWEEGGPSKDMIYSQSLGAFIHFQKSLPIEEELPYLQYSSILFETIEFTDNNPYVNINGLSDDAFKVVTLNCVPCHSVGGVGGAAHHLDFRTVEPQPGFAKPLLTYSHEVLDNFFFNQTETAKLIGVNPNYVEPTIGKELIEWLQPK